MYVYIYVCMYPCMHVCICMYVHVCMYGCMDVWMYGCMDVWMDVCMYVCMCVCQEDLLSKQPEIAQTSESSFASLEAVSSRTQPARDVKIQKSMRAHD